MSSTTIPKLPYLASTSLSSSAQVWVNQGGKDYRTLISDISGIAFIMEFSTIADLRAGGSFVGAGVAAIVESFAGVAATAQGAGLFINQGHTGQTDDGGDYIVSDQNVWLRITDWASASSFGTVGDGVTDDSAALQAWFNCGSTNRVLPPAKQGSSGYLINEPLVWTWRQGNDANAVAPASVYCGATFVAGSAFPAGATMLTLNTTRCSFYSLSWDGGRDGLGSNYAYGGVRVGTPVGQGNTFGFKNVFYNPIGTHTYGKGLAVENGNENSIIRPDIQQWSNMDPEYYNPAGSWTSDGIYMNYHDNEIIGGVARWCKYPNHFGPSAGTTFIKGHHPYNGNAFPTDYTNINSWSYDPITGFLTLNLAASKYLIPNQVAVVALQQNPVNVLSVSGDGVHSTYVVASWPSGTPSAGELWTVSGFAAKFNLTNAVVTSATSTTVVVANAGVSGTGTVGTGVITTYSGSFATMPGTGGATVIVQAAPNLTLPSAPAGTVATGAFVNQAVVYLEPGVQGAFYTESYLDEGQFVSNGDGFRIGAKCLFLQALSATCFLPTYQFAQTISGITIANPGVVTVTAHGMTTGQQFLVGGIVGTTQLNGRSFLAQVIDANTFSMTDLFGNTITTVGMGAYTSGGTIQQANNPNAVRVICDGQSYPYNLQFEGLGGNVAQSNLPMFAGGTMLCNVEPQASVPVASVTASGTNVTYHLAALPPGFNINTGVETFGFTTAGFNISTPTSVVSFTTSPATIVVASTATGATSAGSLQAVYSGDYSLLPGAYLLNPFQELRFGDGDFYVWAHVQGSTQNPTKTIYSPSSTIVEQYMLGGSTTATQVRINYSSDGSVKYGTTLFRVRPPNAASGSPSQTIFQVGANQDSGHSPAQDFAIQVNASSTVQFRYQNNLIIDFLTPSQISPTVASTVNWGSQTSPWLSVWANFWGESTAVGLTASTTHTRPGATQMAAQVNVFGTVANAGDAGALVAMLPGNHADVYNAGAHPMAVFPNGASDNIDGAGAGASVTLTNGLRCRYTCVATNVIISSQLGAASA